MVGSLSQGLKDLYLSPGIGCGKQHRLEKIVCGEMLRAAKSQQLSTRRQSAYCLKIDFFISCNPSREVLPTADKRRRVENDEVERLDRTAQVGKHVGLDKFALSVRQDIILPVLPSKLQG